MGSRFLGGRGEWRGGRGKGASERAREGLARGAWKRFCSCMYIPFVHTLTRHIAHTCVVVCVVSLEMTSRTMEELKASRGELTELERKFLARVASGSSGKGGGKKEKETGPAVVAGGGMTMPVQEGYVQQAAGSQQGLPLECGQLHEATMNAKTLGGYGGGGGKRVMGGVTEGVSEGRRLLGSEGSLVGGGASMSPKKSTKSSFDALMSLDFESMQVS